MGARLKGLDVYSKVHDDCRVRTKGGGFISLAAIAVIIINVVAEFRDYLVVETVDHIIVDTTSDKRLPIGLNITFPHLRCDEISVDTVDKMGDDQVNILGMLHKTDLDGAGVQSIGDYVAKQGECLSCMEANETGNKCCNTCQALKDAYREAGLPYFHVLDKATQCKNNIGCQVTGDIEVHRVTGNIHVALGKSSVKMGKHVHEFDLSEVGDGFNNSHTFNRLQFGAPVKGVESPLEGTTRIVRHNVTMMHYYIKLVPTISTGSDGEQVYTHQYSVTENEKNVMVRNGELSGVPGVFIVYEFSPFLVQKKLKVVPFSHFLTNVSAIIGGIFTVAGMLDAFLYRMTLRLRARALGKKAGASS